MGSIRALLVGLALMGTHGCSDRTEATDQKQDEYLKFFLCDHPQEPCDRRLGIANDHGLTVIVWLKPRNWSLAPIGEKPKEGAPLLHSELIQILPPEAGNCCDVGRSNQYPLSRLQIATSAPFLSSSAGWPIVSCGATIGDWVSCGVGIESRAKFVEVHYSPRSKRAPTQREAWELASAIDEEVRSRIAE